MNKETNERRKLTAEQVREIRAAGREFRRLLVEASKLSRIALSVKYNVAPETIWRVQNKKHYNDIEG